MDDIKDRLLWRADNAGDGFHSDMIYRDAFRCIEAQEKRIEHLNTLLKRLEGSLRASKPLFGAQHFRSVHVGDDLIEDIYAALAGEKKDG